MFPAFSGEWAAQWCAALNASETYRAVAAAWEGSVALVVRADGASEPVTSVFLDLYHGACRLARVATAADLAEAAFVFEAEAPAWREVLSGAGSPLMALMTGKLRLARGELARLLPYASAAKELLTLVNQVPTSFPEDW
jgi:putative sterol carrier protein